MSNRITDKNLDGLCAVINRVTGSPESPYIDGICQVGNYHISHSYGGVCMHRMSNSSGGVSDVLYCGHRTKKELYYMMHAFLKGLEVGGVL